MQTLNKDHLQHLCQFLDTMDIIHLGRAFPTRIPTLKPLFYTKVATKIDQLFREHFGKHYNMFVSIMEQTGTCVSGSFVLQMILLNREYTWDHSDIDFYTPNNGRPSWAKYIHESHNPYLFNDMENFFHYVHRWVGSFDGAYDNVDIDMVREYHTTHTTTQNTLSCIEQKFESFQVISLTNARNQGDVFNFIKNAFDFTMLMNIFYYDNRGHPNVMVNDLKSVLQKRIIFNNNVLTHTVERTLKYIKRGFTFPQ